MIIYINFENSGGMPVTPIMASYQFRSFYRIVIVLIIPEVTLIDSNDWEKSQLSLNNIVK